MRLCPRTPPDAAYPAAFDDRIRRWASVLYAMALLSTALLANLPLGFPTVHRVALNGVILAAAGALLVIWRFPWRRFHRNYFLLVSFPTLLLVALGVAVSGGWGSLLHTFYFPAIVFNASYYRRRLAFALDCCVALASLTPALYAARGNVLLAHALVFVPVYLVVGFVANALTREVQQHEREASTLATQQQESARALARLAALHRAGVLVSAHLDAQAVIRAVVHELSVSLGYHLVGVYLIEGTDLILQAHAGFETVMEREAIAEGVMGRVIRTGSAAFVSRVDQDPDFLAVVSGVVSEICLPLQSDGVTIGVLNVESKAPLTVLDYELLELFAQQVSIALHNAHRHTVVTSVAETDSLTGIPNRGTIMAALDREMKRACLAHAPLSILFADLDHFKRLNDRHGHQCGDDALCVVATVIREVARPGDIVGRYGGEEFLIVLPDTDGEQARPIAEQLRAQAAACDVFASARGGQTNITISVGTVSYPLHASDTATLVARADAALYQAKAQGRDCVCDAGEVREAVVADERQMPESRRVGESAGEDQPCRGDSTRVPSGLQASLCTLETNGILRSDAPV